MSIKMMMELKQLRHDVFELEARISRRLADFDKRLQENSKEKFEHDSSAIELCAMRIRDIESKLLGLQEQVNSDTGRKKRVI